MKMPFGKHKGRYIEDIEVEYLIYIFENYNLKEPLRAAIEDVIKGNVKVPIYFLKNIYRKIALKHHPDRGGRHESMVGVNDFWDEIRKFYE